MHVTQWNLLNKSIVGFAFGKEEENRGTRTAEVKSSLEMIGRLKHQI